MWRTTGAGVAVVLLLSTAAGCLHQRSGGRRECRQADCAAGMEATLAVVDRGQVVADLSALGPYESVELALGVQAVPSEYRALDAGQCQCLAAANSFLGNARDSQRRRLEASTTRSPSKRKAEALQREVLALRAIEERNKSASRALELFFSLAEAESNRDLLERSLRESDAAIDNLRRLKAQGLQIVADEGTLRRQKTEVLDRAVQLHLSIGRLNGELRQLLGFDVNDPTPLWPVTDLRVEVAAVDVEAAVEEGLATRPDVDMLWMIYETLDEDTLPVASVVIALGTGASGSSATSRAWLHKSAASDELQYQRRQAYKLLAQRQRLATGEIRLAAATVEMHLRQMTLAKATLDSWTLRVGRLQQQRTVGQATPFEVSAAKLAAIEAESELIRQVVAWEIARVKLGEAQGVLAYECGWPMRNWRCTLCR